MKGLIGQYYGKLRDTIHLKEERMHVQQNQHKMILKPLIV